ncbi:MAG: tol-pal system protein YbgF [Aquisalinus sp.]|nr:tol-pal system protein YbgF [Aquisalinus sp.]
MSLSRKFKVALAASVALTLSAPAFAQYGNDRDTADRLNRLESAIQDLQGVVYSVEQTAYASPDSIYQDYTADNSYTGNMSTRIGQLERELQNLTGRIEQVAYQIEQNSRRLDTLTAAMSSPGVSAPVSNSLGGDPYGEVYDDNTYSLNDQLRDQTGGQANSGISGGPTDLSSTGAATGTQLPTSSASTSRCAPYSVGDANSTYDQAFDSLLNGDYGQAECKFQAFLDTYPEDPRAPDAQFRLGEIFLATGANLDAARAFLNHVRTWPNDARAPESYLKLGTAYSRLGKTEEACRIFDVTSSKYPNAAPAIRQRLAVERGSAGC